ncbi:hypothetical protein LCGC14_0219880 [marine sediment metagenome]|uniref:Rad50/SbcC-type AAA domain-containing protein n=1 Tax=marine sediment metagenome TaxID=412755 RepID=A0A0F9XGS7_9ZZZZ
MKIVALEAENVKHLKVVNIKPDGSLVVIGGDNAAGKTCVLDSIEYALNGASSIPIKPIRAGQKKARVVLDLGDILVTRTFTAKGTNLTVKNKEGATFASPQAMLDKLVGALTFDPLEFSKMDTKKQSEVLKKLVGLDFDKLNAQHKKLFDERAIVNRRGKELKANLDSMICHKDVPDKEVSVQELSEKYTKAVEHNNKVETALRELDDESDELDGLTKRVAALKKSIKDRQKALSDMEEIDVKTIRSEMSKAEIVNTQVRENKVYTSADYDLGKLRSQSKSLSDQMTEIVGEKAKSLAKAKFPIEGLAIDDDGVTFEDIPFVQCSSAQRIKISVAMGLAMNPKLRILLIREGSLLDSKSLTVIAKMADKADAQIWIERVSKGKECSVILEDGEVLTPEPVA